MFEPLGLADHEHMLQVYLFSVRQRWHGAGWAKLAGNAAALTHDRQCNYG